MNNFTSDSMAEGVQEDFKNKEKASAREELSKKLRVGLNFCSALRRMTLTRRLHLKIC